MANFLASEAEFLQFYGSDHRPVVTTVTFAEGNKKHNFRFDKRLLSIPDFKDLSNKDGSPHFYVGIIISLDQIRECRKSMATCRRHNILNASKRIEELKNKVDVAMSSSGPIRRRIPRFQRELAMAFCDEETYWKTKSRNNWLEGGNRNTKFFHAYTKTRYSKNRIHSIQNTQGITIKGDKAIGDHAKEFFQQIYKSNNNPVLDSIFDNFVATATLEINEAITKEFSNSEICEAVCNIGADKAPGFYQQCWGVVGEDVISEMKYFFHTSSMRPGVNHTDICMIPCKD